jgi:hypothetical protein
MQPLYLARIEDLGRSDPVKVDCAPAIMSRCSRRTFCCGSGSTLGPECSTSKIGSAGADAELGDDPSVKWGRQNG